MCKFDPNDGFPDRVFFLWHLWKFTCKASNRLCELDPPAMEVSHEIMENISCVYIHSQFLLQNTVPFAVHLFFISVQII